MVKEQRKQKYLTEYVLEKDDLKNFIKLAKTCAIQRTSKEKV